MVGIDPVTAWIDWQVPGNLKGVLAMQITRNDRVRMERAHVSAWPALQTAQVEGWLWRASGGGSQRANSVSTIDFTGTDVNAAITAIEARYRALNAPVRFQTYDETLPTGLADSLRHRGYQEGESTITMFRSNERASGQCDTDQRDQPWQDWTDIYFGAITENRRTTNARILANLTAPHMFFCHQSRATALCVVSHGCAVVECVATRSKSRRQGAGRAVMAGLLTWAAGQPADWVGLQVVADNIAAVRLYQSLGFVAGATNRFWVKL